MRVVMSKYSGCVPSAVFRNEKAVVVQKITHGYLVRRRDLLHPFGDMDHKELDAKIDEMERPLKMQR
ncbi:hypothetical protein DVH05_017152 [Phytophthora capsici]|nr:hypothetical protein DVH05_017152 [Phytophthora capsici]